MLLATKAATATEIQQIAARLEPAMRQKFLAAVERAKGQADIEAIARAVMSGNLTQAELAIKLREWPEVYKPMQESMRAGFLAGVDTGNRLFEGASLQLRLDLINPYAVTYAQRKLPKIVAEYMEGAKETIRTITTEAVSGLYDARSAAVAIRDTIGLTKRYERAVNSLRQDLIAEGLTGERLETKVDRYAHKLLTARARTIARTEIIQAQVAGQNAVWVEAARQGLVNRQTTKRVWRVAKDERLCDLCRVMDGETATIEGLYTHPELGQVDVFGEPLDGPPLHPNCRCHETLKL